MSKKKTVLVIDDEADLRETVEYKLKSKGYDVVTACDGIDALEKLKTVSPDLITLDMNMPRMNGLEFYYKIATGDDDRPKYPVLVLTARANMEQLFRELDVDGFIAKPFDLDVFCQEAESILKKYMGSIVGDNESDGLRARRICIVDDDRDALNELAIYFLEAGYIVNTAQNGASFISRTHMDIPDVAIVKLGLNDITGDVAIAKLKKIEKFQKIKFILYSKDKAGESDIVKNILDREINDQFVQTDNISELFDVVELLFL